MWETGQGRGSRRVRGKGMLGFKGHHQKWKDNSQNARRFLQIILSDQGRVSREYVTEHMFLPKETRTQAGHTDPDPLWAACIVIVSKGHEALHLRPPAWVAVKAVRIYQPSGRRDTNGPGTETGDRRPF